MNKNLKVNYSTDAYSTQMYAKKLKVELPILTQKDRFILYLYARYLGYKLIIEKKKAIVVNGVDQPGFIQKVRDRLIIRFKDGSEDFINPKIIIDGMSRRFKSEFSVELIKAKQYAASCLV